MLDFINEQLCLLLHGRQYSVHSWWSLPTSLRRWAPRLIKFCSERMLSVWQVCCTEEDDIDLQCRSFRFNGHLVW